MDHILLDENKNVIISDYGISAVLDEKDYLLFTQI